MTTGDVAKVSHIPQQTLISWDRNGVLKAVARPGRRAARRYDEDGLIAAMFAHSASEMGFRGDRLAQMVQLMQAGKRKDLEKAAIFSYWTYPGIMTHVFSPDIRRSDDRRYLAWLRRQKRLVEKPASLWATREAIRPTAHQIAIDGRELMPGYFEEVR